MRACVGALLFSMMGCADPSGAPAAVLPLVQPGTLSVSGGPADIVVFFENGLRADTQGLAGAEAAFSTDLGESRSCASLTPRYNRSTPF